MFLLLDIREPEDYELFHIKEGINDLILSNQLSSTKYFKR